MLYDHQVHRQLARERADELARDYGAQPASHEPRPEDEVRPRFASLAARLRRRKVDRAPAAGA